jgi:3-deoxy-D-manno-octulosonate 8-phosphate phosphatase (KDO 8-P phosphatase)
LLKGFKQITCFAFDVDGVLTDGTVLLLDDGQQARRMSIRDGYALQLAVKKGYKVVIISGAYSEAVKTRLNRLGITDVFMKVENKEQQLNEYVQLNGLSPAQVLFMGDDIPDYMVMKKVGMPCCPADAAPEIRRISTYISVFRGGHGCVREVIEKVMKLNDHWELDSTVASK